MVASARPPIVFMFSGQGSQYYRMGQHLRAEHPGFDRCLRHLDDVARSALGTSVLDIVYDGSRSVDTPFDRLLYSHPAILMIELALADVLRDAGVSPDYVLGTSLGELASAVAAGSIGADEAILVAVEQARLAEAHCPAGGMIAVLHDVSLADDPAITAHCHVVAVSFNAHFVVAGTDEGLSRVASFLRERAILHHPLPVRFPFHTPLLGALEPPYLQALASLSFRAPAIPFASSAEGAIIRELGPEYFWRVVRQPILFREAVAAIEDREKDAIYVDLGPSSSLAAFLNRELGARARDRIYAIMSPFYTKTKQRLDKVVGACLGARRS